MEHLIALSVAIFVIVGMWAVSHVGRQKHLTISQHVAKTRKTQIGFGIGASIATLIAAWTILAWLLPGYSAGAVSYVLFGTVLAGFLIAAAVPYIKGSWRGSLHNIAAWGMCYIIPLAMLSSLWWPLSDIAWLSTVVLVTTEIVLLAMFHLKKDLRKSFLTFQSAYLGIFYVFLLIVAYF